MAATAIVAIASNAAAQSTATYQYDAFGRVTAATYTSGAQTTYAYDSADNRSNLTTTTGATTPTAVVDTVVTNPTSPVTFDPRANDISPLGYPLTVTGVTQGTGGTVTYTSSLITYTPQGSGGWDSFTYTISDGHSHTATATVLVSVAETPSASASLILVPHNSTGYQFNPAASASSALGYAIAISGVTTPSHGGSTFTPSSVTYTPTGGFAGSDAFSYTVSDGHGGTATAAITVEVNSATPPTAVNQNFTLKDNSPGKSFNPLSGDSSSSGYTLSIMFLGSPQLGTATINSGNTSFTYVPNGIDGSDTFSYTISDGHNGFATANITVVVTVSVCGYC